MPYSEIFGEIDWLMLDYDNTLIYYNEENFIKEYFVNVAQEFSDVVDIKVCIKYLIEASESMNISDGSRSNLERFLDNYQKYFTNMTKDAILERFKDISHNKLRAYKINVKRDPLAIKLLEKVLNKGYKVIIATNPVLPMDATMARLSWAKLDQFKEKYSLVTTSDNMHYTKPKIEYYKEILEKNGIKDPSKCLMVGNEITNDGSCSLVGIKFYLLVPDQENTPFNKNANQNAIKISYTGTLEKLYNNL